MNREENFSSTVGIIISTYNNPAWLEKVLWGYAFQSYKDFEIIIAEDGSTKETFDLINRFREKTQMKITHVWQEDEGFQKNRILNKALVAANSEYLIFSDQDCIPRRDFVETHITMVKKGYFLSGGCFRLPMTISQYISFVDIENQSVFDLKWLRSKGLKLNFKCTKLCRNKYFTQMMNVLTPTKSSWNGGNSSGWRSDFLAINGFNENMQYGGEDREFGERLINYRIKSRQIRYSAICVHLDHNRPYITEEMIGKNKAIRKQIRITQQIETPNGIRKYPDAIKSMTE